MNDIAKKIKEGKPKTMYAQACEKFGVSYIYVVQIATGVRQATRGKGFLVKNWLLDQIDHNTKTHKKLTK